MLSGRKIGAGAGDNDLREVAMSEITEGRQRKRAQMSPTEKWKHKPISPFLRRQRQRTDRFPGAPI